MDAFSMKVIYSGISKNYFNGKMKIQKRAEQDNQYSNPYSKNNYTPRPRDNLSPRRAYKNEYFKKEIN